jgi:hypothetical protein
VKGVVIEGRYLAARWLHPRALHGLLAPTRRGCESLSQGVPGDKWGCSLHYEEWDKREQNLWDYLLWPELSDYASPLEYRTGLSEDPSMRITPGEWNGQRERLVDCEVIGEFPNLPQCTKIPNKLPICLLFVLLVHVMLLNLAQQPWGNKKVSP